MMQRTDGAGTARSAVESGFWRISPFSLLLYVAFPLFAGFISAMQGSGRTSDWPLGFRIAYYIPLALLVMASCGLSCALLSRLFRALKLPLWLLLIVGVLVAGEVIKLYVRSIVPVFDKLLPDTAVGGRVVEFTIAGNLEASIPTIATWVGLNLLAWYIFRIDRFGYGPPSKGRAGSALATAETENPTSAVASTPSRVPNFLRKANIASLDQVQAVEAQQHYIKIHTATGTKIILYRFTDAISEVDDGDGVRVHRSWWVHRNSVVATEEDQNRLILRLSSGLRVPVSRTYQLHAMEAFQTAAL